MLTGLGHDTLISRDHQGHQINPRRPRYHVADKALMARHIDDAQTMTTGQVEEGKAQLDGNSPSLLLLEAIGIDSG